MTYEDPIEGFERRLGYAFKDKKLIEQALTHRSFVNEARYAEFSDNERLEFLGDAVIDLVVSSELMRRFPDENEGTLSRLRASLVNESGLAQVAGSLDLGAALRLGRGEVQSGGRERASILSDAFEAVLAAVYVEAGLSAAEAVLLQHLEYPAALSTRATDPKTELQERVQAEQRITPRYRVVDEQGPDHNKTFEVEILCDGHAMGRGRGRTKKEAEQAAARQALERMERGDSV